MSALTSTVMAITKMVQGRLKAVPFDPLIGQPTRHSVRHLIDQIAGFTIHFSSSHWWRRHGCLTLMLSDAEMRLVTGDAALYCARLPLLARINAQITDATVGRALLHLQEEHNVVWQGTLSKPFWMQLASNPSSPRLTTSMSRNSLKTTSDTKTKPSRQ